MRFLKIVVVTLIGLSIVGVFALAGGIFWAINNPKSAWGIVQTLALPNDLTVDWEKMDVLVQHPQWNTWDVTIQGAKVVVRKGSPAIEAPFETVSTHFRIGIFQPRPWLHVHDLQVQGGEKIAIRSAPPSPDADPTRSPFEQLRSIMNLTNTTSKYITFDKIGLRIPMVEMEGPGGDATKLKLEVRKPMKPDLPFVAQIAGAVEAGETKVGVNGWLDVTRMKGLAPFVQLKIDTTGKNWRALTEITGKYDGTKSAFDGETKFAYGEAEAKKVQFKPKFQLVLNQVEALLTLNGALVDIPGPVVKLDDLNVEMHLPFDNGYLWSERPATFKIVSPVALFFVDKDMRPPLEKSCRCKIPETVMVEINGRAWFEHMLNADTDKRTVLETKISVQSLDNKLFTSALAAHLRIEKTKNEWRLDPRVDSTFKLHSFQGFRQFLDARNVIIPAPFDILDGGVQISARSPVTNDDKYIRTVVEIATDLASETQKVVVSANINLDLARDFKSLDVFVHALLKDVRLELPPLDPVLGIPPIAKDSRVLLKPAKIVKGPSGFKMQVFLDVKTVNAGSVRLLSPLASPHIPVTVEVNTAAKGESTGSIRLEPFTIKYLRRNLNVERMQISLAEDESGGFPVGGRVRIEQSSYKIFVDIAGTSSAPSVQLNSEPYLPRSDIIAVLLYGRTNDQLVGGDAETSASFEAAMADRAIGLIGLWAFASTPIQSFSYNAATKVYTATVQLGDGLTAGVGTNWERAAHLEVRKRVSRRWVLTASWSPTGEREQVGKLVLQWEKRF